VSGITARVRETVLQRDGMKCVSCGRFVDRSNYSIHHRMPRGMGGTRNPEVNLPANLLTLCGSGTTGCHGWLESHRVKANEWGYLIRRGTASPSFEPVLTADGWRRFDNDGGIEDAYPTNHGVEKQRELDAHAERARLERTGEAA
jgi:hypothetical protein